MINLDVSNYRGSLHAKHEDGKFFWAVECDMDYPKDWDWEEIPKYLFDALTLYSNHDEPNDR